MNKLKKLVQTPKWGILRAITGAVAVGLENPLSFVHQSMHAPVTVTTARLDSLNVK